MNRRGRIVIVLIALALALLVAAWVYHKNNGAPKPLLTLRLKQPSSATNTQLSFDVVNNGKSPVMCPDSWFLEFKDGTRQNLSLARSGDVRVAPGAIGTIAILKPTNTLPWRLGTHCYEEDIVFEAKVRASLSPLQQVLPPDATTIQATIVVGDWNE